MPFAYTFTVLVPLAISPVMAMCVQAPTLSTAERSNVWLPPLAVFQKVSCSPVRKISNASFWPTRSCRSATSRSGLSQNDTV